MDFSTEPWQAAQGNPRARREGMDGTGKWQGWGQTRVGA